MKEKDFEKLYKVVADIFGEDYFIMSINNDKIWTISNLSSFECIDDILKEYMGEKYDVYKYVDMLKEGELEELKRLSKISYYKRQIEKLESEMNFD